MLKSLNSELDKFTALYAKISAAAVQVATIKCE